MSAAHCHSVSPMATEHHVEHCPWRSAAGHMAMAAAPRPRGIVEAAEEARERGTRRAELAMAMCGRPCVPACVGKACK